MSRPFADISFTPSVRAAQAKYGAAGRYAGFLDDDAPGRDCLGAAEVSFISARDGFYQATVSATGWPYVQFRGGPVGFLKVLDGQTIAYADFRGNRQYISTGNLADNDRVSLILMDYPNRQRLKIWGRATLTDAADNPALMTELTDLSYRGRPERAVQIAVEAFDWNCPQHIPQRLTFAEMEQHLQPVHARIAELTAENERLRNALDQPT